MVSNLDLICPDFITHTLCVVINHTLSVFILLNLKSLASLYIQLIYTICGYQPSL